jgi:hypothetical protein
VELIMKVLEAIAAAIAAESIDHNRISGKAR